MSIMIHKVQLLFLSCLRCLHDSLPKTQTNTLKCGYSLGANLNGEAEGQSSRKGITTGYIARKEELQRTFKLQISSCYAS